LVVVEKEGILLTQHVLADQPVGKVTNKENKRIKEEDTQDYTIVSSSLASSRVS